MEDQISILCGSQQPVGNLKLPRAYKEEIWKSNVSTVWKEKAYNLVRNLQTDVHFKCEKEKHCFPAPAGETRSTGATLTSILFFACELVLSERVEI